MKPAVATYQVEWEMGWFRNLVYSMDPRKVLEVGCFEGGTLWEWLQIADTVVAVDDVCRNADEWNDWAHASDCDLHTLLGDSRDESIIQSVRDRGPYDFVFIDGDHTYEAVRADVDNYGTMIAPGGILALHDILPREGYGVSRVWSELKSIQGVRYVEIAKNGTEPGNEGPCGIGVLWV